MKMLLLTMLGFGLVLLGKKVLGSTPRPLALPAPSEREPSENRTLGAEQVPAPIH